MDLYHDGLVRYPLIACIQLTPNIDRFCFPRIASALSARMRLFPQLIRATLGVDCAAGVRGQSQLGRCDRSQRQLSASPFILCFW